MVINTPNDLPDPTLVDYIQEPYIHAQVITKPEYIGAIMNLCLEKRGMLMHQNYLTLLIFKCWKLHIVTSGTRFR